MKNSLFEKGEDICKVIELDFGFNEKKILLKNINFTVNIY